MDFSKFTDGSRKVMQLANQEAQLFNHEYIGTEHVLIALARHEGCVAATVLFRLGVTLDLLRKGIKKIVGDGPEMVSIGKLPQTPRTKAVLEYAIEEARSLGHNYIGTEHILLGLIRESEGIAAQLLKNIKIDPLDVRREVMVVLDSGYGKSVAENDQPKSEQAERRGYLEMPLNNRGRYLVIDFPLDISQEEIDHLVKSIQWAKSRP